MWQQDYDSSSSGFIADSFAGISRTFTDVEIISVSEVNVVAKGKRYGRWWLLKGLVADVSHREAYLQMLRKELDIMMMLRHVGVVNAVGLEEIDGFGSCIVMEYIEGRTLKEWLQESPLKSERKRVADELLGVVAYIHSEGIVHRDLKPQNVIITRNGAHVKLIDFGLADTDSHSVLKQPAGTMRYVSPEQLTTSVADVRNDIYSLGVMLREMRLGYGAIVNRCLKSIDKRYQNMEELQQALVHMHWRRRAFVILIAVWVVLSVIAGITYYQQSKTEQISEELVGHKQSVQQMQTTIHTLRDSLQTATTNYRELEAKQEEQRKQRERIEQAIRQGYTTIDEVIKKSKSFRIFDTLTHRMYMEDNGVNAVLEINNATSQYLKQIRTRFTEMEQAEISNVLYLYCNKQIEKRINKFNQTIIDGKNN